MSCILSATVDSVRMADPHMMRLLHVAFLDDPVIHVVDFGPSSGDRGGGPCLAVDRHGPDMGVMCTDQTRLRHSLVDISPLLAIQ